MKYIIATVRILFLALFLFLVAKGKMMLWLALFGVSLIAAVIFGRVYCGYVCPMNTVMVPAEWISKKLHWNTDRSPKWLAKEKFGWFALAASMAVMLYAKRALNKNVPILLIWMGIAILLTLRYKPAVFHNHICPFGILQKELGRFAKFSNKTDKEKCIGCKLCEKVCPSESIEVKTTEIKAEISKAYCLQCANCQQVCPADCIHYSG